MSLGAAALVASACGGGSTLVAGSSGTRARGVSEAGQPDGRALGVRGNGAEDPGPEGAVEADAALGAPLFRVLAVSAEVSAWARCARSGAERRRATGSN